MNRFWGELVHELAELALRGEIAEVRGAILDELGKRIPFAGASFHSFGPDACEDPNTATRGIGRMLLERISSRWAMQLAEIDGPPLANLTELGVARIDDLGGDVRAKRTWTEVFVAVGVSDTLNAFIQMPASIPRLLVLIRTDGARFTDEERDAVAYLLPFLIMAERQAESPVNQLPLTPAQKKIVERLRRGLTNDEIAADLQLSAKTVRNQLSDAYERCGVTNRTELVAILQRPDLAAQARPKR